jgi:hypothetical protein
MSGCEISFAVSDEPTISAGTCAFGRSDPTVLICGCLRSATQGFARNTISIAIQAGQATLIKVKPRFGAACHLPTVVLTAAGETLGSWAGRCCDARARGWNGSAAIGTTLGRSPLPWRHALGLWQCLEAPARLMCFLFKLQQ